MPIPILQVDLSNKSQDFEWMVLQAGTPLIDKRGAHYQILRGWLKGQTAEPELAGQKLAFFVRNDDGARLDNIRCAPVSEDDLASGPLRKELERLIKAIQKASASTPTEEAVLKIARDELLSLTTQSNKGLRCFYLMKYQDAQNKWRLLWCPGYRRKDADQSPPAVCKHANCRHLYARRPDVKKCPVCQMQADTAGAGDSQQDRKRGGIAGKLIALVLLAAAGFFVWQQYLQQEPEEPDQPKLVVAPDAWSGPVGALFDFEVTTTGPDGASATTDVEVQSSDPLIVARDPDTQQFKAYAVGTATLEFRSGELTATVPVTVEPPANPVKISIEPAEVALGIGTTTRLKLLGETEGGDVIDLTDDAEWLPGGEVVFAYQGMLEGRQEGQGSIRARYRATPDNEFMEATAEITVAVKNYTALTIGLDSLEIPLSRSAKITAEVKTDSDETYSVAESSQLSLKTEPESSATIQGAELTTKKTGRVTLTGEFQGLTDAIQFVVGEPPVSPPLSVKPEILAMVIGEISDLTITAGPGDIPIRVVSDNPDVVRITDENRLVGLSAGSARVEIFQGMDSVATEVTVAAGETESLHFEPDVLTIRVDDSQPLKLMGTLADEREFEVDPSLLNWQSLPRPNYALLDTETLRVTGKSSTGDDHEVMMGTWGDLAAQAQVKVISAPLRLELSPEGPFEIPVGQAQDFEVFAAYGDGQRTAVPLERIEWLWDAESGLMLRDGTLHSEEAGIGPVKLQAVYQGVESNTVEASSVPAVPLTLTVKADPDQPAVGDTGVVSVTAASPGGEVPVSEDGLSFETSDETIVAIDAASGAFRALQAGTATITVKHPAADDPATMELTVLEAAPTPDDTPEITAVRIVSSQAAPIRVSQGTEFSDYRVEADDAAGETHDVTDEADVTPIGDINSVSAPLVWREGRILAAEPGLAQLTASFGGVDAAERLAIEVVAEFKVDEIRIEPQAARIAVGETVQFTAEGFLDGKSIGVITDRPEVIWTVFDPDTDSTAPGASSMTGAIPHGTAGSNPEPERVTAAVGDVVSNEATITVVDDVEDVMQPLTVNPDTLRLQVGESRDLGTEIAVLRGSVDLAESAEVSVANALVALFDADRRAVVGVSPGTTQVTFSAGGQLVNLDVEVVPAPPLSPDSQVELEPAGGVLYVGEQVNLRAYLVCESCGQQRTGRTGSAVMSSSDTSVLRIDGNALLGLAPGVAEITGRLPGVETPATVQFRVIEANFSRLLFRTPRINLTPGQERPFSLYAITPGGRRRLGPHPDLALSLQGPSPASVELQSAGQSVTGLTSGEAELLAQWRDRPSATAKVVVNGPPVRGLRIEPPTAVVAVGETQGYQVFARVGSQWRPMNGSPGLTVDTSDPSVARMSNATLVEGVRPGNALVRARFGSFRAEAQLSVSGSRTPPTPRGPPVALEFIPDVFRLQMGTPGDSIRVVRVYADGSREDVDHLATLTVRDPSDVIELESTASGPVVRPRRIGQTQVDAQLENLRTQSPLLVDVAESLSTPARLRVSPNPIRVDVGETQPIVRVQVVPGRGRQPFETPYELSASPTPIIAVDDDRKEVRGLQAGSAVVAVTINDADSPYDGLQAAVTVEVGDGGSPPIGTNFTGPRLELDGPTVTTVGAEVPLQVELIEGTASQLVTSSSDLSIPPSEQSIAEVLPGCRILALAPGTIHVEARSGSLTSNSHTIRIEPPAVDFERLVLTAGDPRMTVGEVRAYELWGYPRGGGPRQNLTNLVTSDPAQQSRPYVSITPVPPAEPDIIEHNVPQLIANGEGRFRMYASLGSELRSNPLELLVVAGSGPIQLRIEPPRAVLREGSWSEQFRVLVRSRDSTVFREIDNATLVSLDEEVLTPAESEVRRFQALRPGTTQVRATFGNLSQVAEIEVIPDRYRSIRSGLNMGGTRFSLDLDIRSSPSSAQLEYRVVPPQPGVATEWVPAVRLGEEMSAQVKTPEQPLGPKDTIYRLMLESRDRNSRADSVERYPYSFRITTDIVEQQR